MRRLMRVWAFATSLLAFLVIAGLGSTMAAVEQSGAQALGSALVFGGIVAFAAAMLLVFAPRATFLKAGGRALAIVATIAALVPLVGLLLAIAMFVRPFGSVAPALDFGLFALGVAFAAGAACVCAIGFLRLERLGWRLPDSVHVSAAEAARRNQPAETGPLPRFAPREAELRPGERAVFDFDDEVRVTRV